MKKQSARSSSKEHIVKRHSTFVASLVIAIVALSILAVFVEKPTGQAISSGSFDLVGGGIILDENTVSVGESYVIPLKANLGSDSSVDFAYTLRYDPTQITVNCLLSDVLGPVVEVSGQPVTRDNTIVNCDEDEGIMAIWHTYECDSDGEGGCSNALSGSDVILANIEVTVNDDAQGEIQLTMDGLDVYDLSFDSNDIIEGDGQSAVLEVVCSENVHCGVDGICFDGVCGTFADCQEISHPACPECQSNEHCGIDGICFDGVCGTAQDCNEVTHAACPEVCDDGRDNDGNGAIDCADTLCEGADACASPPDCTQDSDCEEGLICGDGVCVECTQAIHCDEGWKCGAGNVCVSEGLGPGCVINGVVDVAGGEECDDGNNLDGDGCDHMCVIEDGWNCVGEPSVCGQEGEIAQGCTIDGVVDTAGGEQCDDDNNHIGDGCDNCFIESGWECSGEPSVCIESVVCEALGQECTTDGEGLTCYDLYGAKTCVSNECPSFADDMIADSVTNTETCASDDDCAEGDVCKTLGDTTRCMTTASIEGFANSCSGLATFCQLKEVYAGEVCILDEGPCEDHNECTGNLMCGAPDLHDDLITVGIVYDGPTDMVTCQIDPQLCAQTGQTGCEQGGNQIEGVIPVTDSDGNELVCKTIIEGNVCTNPTCADAIDAYLEDVGLAIPCGNEGDTTACPTEPDEMTCLTPDEASPFCVRQTTKTTLLDNCNGAYSYCLMKKALTGELCSMGQGECSGDNECQEGLTCADRDGLTSQCVCATDAACGDGKVCTDGVCEDSIPIAEDNSGQSSSGGPSGGGSSGGGTRRTSDTTTSEPDTSGTEAGHSAQCGDNIDNDGDGLVDFPDDPGCTSEQDNREYSEEEGLDVADEAGDGSTGEGLVEGEHEEESSEEPSGMGAAVWWIIAGLVLVIGGVLAYVYRKEWFGIK